MVNYFCSLFGSIIEMYYSRYYLQYSQRSIVNQLASLFLRVKGHVMQMHCKFIYVSYGGIPGNIDAVIAKRKQEHVNMIKNTLSFQNSIPNVRHWQKLVLSKATLSQHMYRIIYFSQSSLVYHFLLTFPVMLGDKNAIFSFLSKSGYLCQEFLGTQRFVSYGTLCIIYVMFVFSVQKI